VYRLRVRVQPPSSLINIIVSTGHTLSFPGECCFQVIYFNPNFSFECCAGSLPRALAETSWLMRAVNNAWANRPARMCVEWAVPIGAVEEDWRELCR
jgi:hypothetical protein